MKKYILFLAFLATVFVSAQQLQSEQVHEELGQFLPEKSPFEMTGELELDGKFIFGRISVPQRAAVPQTGRWDIQKSRQGEQRSVGFVRGRSRIILSG